MPQAVLLPHTCRVRASRWVPRLPSTLLHSVSACRPFCRVGATRLCVLACVLGSKELLVMKVGFFPLRAMCLLSSALVFNQWDGFWMDFASKLEEEVVALYAYVFVFCFCCFPLTKPSFLSYVSHFYCTVVLLVVTSASFCCLLDTH